MGLSRQYLGGEGLEDLRSSFESRKPFTFVSFHKYFNTEISITIILTVVIVHETPGSNTIRTCWYTSGYNAEIDRRASIMTRHS